VIGVSFKQRAKFCISDYFIDNLEKANNLVSSTTGRNFDEFKIGRAA
jgi:hypothetical protein